jgi:predicted pyridoxine 5'-phosphate oxidase superfamily flavin-nucleotide-binding protein
VAKISNDIKNFLKQQKLGFVATINNNNTPNLSPRGTIFAWDDEHIIFADIKSPQTTTNLEKNPIVEVNVINPITRKGFLLSGNAVILKEGREFSQILEYYKDQGIQSKIVAVAKVKIDEIHEITSPLYDLGYSEDEIKEKWKKYYQSF